jgi:outer membrane biosynthesis protein TonB
MNTSPVHIISVGVLLAGSLLAQTPASPAAWQSMKIIQTTTPAFPKHVLQIGVLTGEARVVINTDADGKLLETLVLGYTLPEFADVAVAAMKEWKFEPARLKGEPVGTIVELDFDFSVNGVVVTNPNITETVEARLLRVRPDRFIYLPRAARALDKTPTPIVVVMPQYSTDLAKRGFKGSVQIEFFIDETGAVRLPSGSADQSGVLSQLAIEALKQWKFTPPTCRGKGVLVRASQEFLFGSGS